MISICAKIVPQVEKNPATRSTITWPRTTSNAFAASLTVSYDRGELFSVLPSKHSPQRTHYKTIASLSDLGTLFQGHSWKEHLQSVENSLAEIPRRLRVLYFFYNDIFKIFFPSFISVHFVQICMHKVS